MYFLDPLDALCVVTSPQHVLFPNYCGPEETWEPLRSTEFSWEHLFRGETHFDILWLEIYRTGCLRPIWTSTITTTLTRTSMSTCRDTAVRGRFIFVCIFQNPILGKQRSKTEAAMNTNRPNPGGHERKIMAKLMNAEKNNQGRQEKSWLLSIGVSHFVFYILYYSDYPLVETNVLKKLI